MENWPAHTKKSGIAKKSLTPNKYGFLEIKRQLLGRLSRSIQLDFDV